MIIDFITSLNSDYNRDYISVIINLLSIVVISFSLACFMYIRSKPKAGFTYFCYGLIFTFVITPIYFYIDSLWWANSSGNSSTAETTFVIFIAISTLMMGVITSIFQKELSNLKDSSENVKEQLKKYSELIQAKELNMISQANGLKKLYALNLLDKNRDLSEIMAIKYILRLYSSDSLDNILKTIKELQEQLKTLEHFEDYDLDYLGKLQCSGNENIAKEAEKLLKMYYKYISSIVK